MDEKEKLAYLAGIIDGEGNIDIAKGPIHNRMKSPSYSLRLAVGNTDEKLLLWLKDNFGGSIYKQLQRPNRKPSWTWTLTNKKAFQLLLEIKDLSVIKQEQINIAIEFQEKTVGRFFSRRKPLGLVNKQEAYHKEIKKLHL